jgi:CPA2 family monovalent cation:H+ antiporter-2
MPEFEAGIEMTRKTLSHLHIPATRIYQYTDSLRESVSASLPEQTDQYTLLTQLKSAEHLFDLQWVTIGADSPLADRTLEEADIRQTTGTSVVGVVRNKELTLNPGASFRIRAADMVALIGTDKARETFFKTFLPGASSPVTLEERTDIENTCTSK